MRITLDQFQTDFVTGLDSVVVGAQWLQEVLKERNKFYREIEELKKVNSGSMLKVSKLQARVLELEAKDKNIYILDTLA